MPYLFVLVYKTYYKCTEVLLFCTDHSICIPQNPKAAIALIPASVFNNILELPSP